MFHRWKRLPQKNMFSLHKRKERTRLQHRVHIILLFRTIPMMRIKLPQERKNTIIVVVICVVAVIAVAFIACIVSLIIGVGKDISNNNKWSYSSSSDIGSNTNSATESEPFIPSTTELQAGTYWYGFAKIYNHESNEGFKEGIYEVWGIIGTDTSGKTFFELYDTYEMDGSPILSYWVDLQSDHVDADIGEDDAWLLDIYLI